MNNPLTITQKVGEKLSLVTTQGNQDVLVAPGDGFVSFAGTRDGRVLTDGVVANGSPLLISASAGFKRSDVGKVVLVAGGGVAGADLATTIATFISSTQVRMAANAGANLPAATWGFGTDNITKLRSTLAELSGTGATLLIPFGTYAFGGDVDCSLLDNVTISGYGATFLVATPGSTKNFFGGGSTLGPILALNADVVAYQKQFVLTTGAPLAVGDVVTLNATELASLYTVTAVSGSGPQTVTVDRVILFPYLLIDGSRVNKVTHLITNFNIEGLTFIGSCEQYVKIRNIEDSRFRDLRFLDTISFASGLAFLLSLASVNVQWDNIVVHGPAGGGMAACESCWITRYLFIGSTSSPFALQHGFEFLNSANCGIENFEINGALVNGIDIEKLGAISAAVPDDIGIVIADGLIAGCAGSGLVDNGWYTVAENVLVVDNALGGIVLGARSECPQVLQCKVLSNRGVGIACNAGIGTGSASWITDCVISDNVADVTTFASGIAIQAARTYVTGCQIEGKRGAASGLGITYLDPGGAFGCSVAVDDCDFLIPGTSTGASILSLSGANCFATVTHCRQIFTGGAGFVGSGINHLVGKMYLDNVQTILRNATVPASGLATVAGTLTRIGANCNFDGCTAPVAMGGFCSRSIPGSTNANSVTLNGVAAVAYPFTDTKSTDRVTLNLTTRGGTPGNGAVLVAVIPGTGITLAGNGAGVNDVYDVVIG